MKRIVFSCMVFLLLGAVAHATSVLGSKHDMTTWIANESTTQVCVFCHAPHGGTSAAPLWNHSLSNATYTLYTSSTLQGQVSQPVSVSKACLSCHDGTVAINSLIVPPRDGGVGTSGAGGRSLFMNSADDGGAYVGTNLSNLNPNHPVSITYRPDLDKGLRSNTGDHVFNGSITLPLYGGAAPYTVECGSCHNVHDPANIPFLRVPNTSNQLCSTCHLQ